MTWALRFLGTGDARADESLGDSSAVLEQNGTPRLMIDCGPMAVTRYLAHYGAPPPAVYITHTHLDHVGGFERLFATVEFDATLRGQTQVFVHAAVVPLLHQRVADYRNVLAEGSANFWEAFRLVPCTRGFWLGGHWFDLFATRHHAPGTSFGLRLPGSFIYTGDTRPIPEMLKAIATADEPVFHDCGLVPNPSHTGVTDLAREYPAALLARLHLYHYGSLADGAAMATQGWRVMQPGQCIELPTPLPVADDAG